ncbi:MAG: YitT family protein [Lachnospiraceae bacterium]|nr:YitT family protein [Lachnospiraceae bacterium]
MRKILKKIDFKKDLIWVLTILIGSALYSLGFDLFWKNASLNGGGVSGLALVIVKITGFASVGVLNFIINIPLFIAGRAKLGNRFFFGSCLGMLFSSITLDLFDRIHAPALDNVLLPVIYGGIVCGFGIGLIVRAGASAGGSDILIRLVKMKYQNASVGTISMIIDCCVILLNALVFRDIQTALYSGISVFIYSKVFDAVIYSFDFSRVALIISKDHEAIAKTISEHLHRGVTFLEGEGYYTREHTRIVMTALPNKQLPELKQLVTEADPNAFVIIQDSHNILGEGFQKYSKTNL